MGHKQNDNIKVVIYFTRMLIDNTSVCVVEEAADADLSM